MLSPCRFSVRGRGAGSRPDFISTYFGGSAAGRDNGTLFATLTLLSALVAGLLMLASGACLRYIGSRRRRHPLGESKVIFVWRGWGPVAAIALFLPLASCAGLMDWDPAVALGCFSVSLVAGGFACRYYGLKWNQGSGLHTMYWIPLEIWGWIYIAIGGLFGLLIAVGLIKQVIVG